jgi:hypothetical protein
MCVCMKFISRVVRTKGRKGAHAHLERTEERFVHAHDGTRVVKLAAVVRRREDRDELAFREEFITVLDDLNSPAVLASPHATTDEQS